MGKDGRALFVRRNRPGSAYRAQWSKADASPPCACCPITTSARAAGFHSSAYRDRRDPRSSMTRPGRSRSLRPGFPSRPAPLVHHALFGRPPSAARDHREPCAARRERTASCSPPPAAGLHRPNVTLFRPPRRCSAPGRAPQAPRFGLCLPQTTTAAAAAPSAVPATPSRRCVRVTVRPVPSSMTGSAPPAIMPGQRPRESARRPSCRAAAPASPSAHLFA